MVGRLDMDGMKRLAAVQLAHRNPSNRQDAMRYLQRSLGAYDIDPLTLEAGVDSYFAAQHS